MALSDPVLLTADPDTTNGASFDTPSLSPSANAKLVAWVQNSDGSDTADVSSFSSAFSVVGGSWTNQGTLQHSGLQSQITVFTATTTSSPGSGACTAAFGGDNQTGCIIHVIEVTGDVNATFEQFENTDTGTGTSATLDLDAAPDAGGKVVWVIFGNSLGNYTATGGGTILTSSDVEYSTPNRSGAVIWATGDQSVGATFTSRDWVAAGIEIRPSAGYSLTVDPGAYTVTGTTAGTVAGRQTTADPGSYALTGADAGVPAGRALEATPAAFVLTGFDTTVLTTRVLPATPASYVITGFDADLVFTGVGAYSLDAQPGVFTLSGVDATVVAGRAIAVDPGSFVVTGVAATVLATRTLNAASGSFTVTGFDAQLVHTIPGAAPARNRTLLGVGT